MPFIDPVNRFHRTNAAARRLGLAGVGALLMALGGCASLAPPPAAPPAPPAPTAPPPPPPAPKPAARPAADWVAYQREAALKLVKANPERTYLGEVPEPLLAIPVLEVELHADGSVRQIHVRRVPGQARDTIELARQAILRAAPFGSVTHLPKPWAFTEVFLFNDDRRFKPRTLDD